MGDVVGDPGSNVSRRWAEWRRSVDLDRYDARWQAMADRGEHVHGEADFVDWLLSHESSTSSRILDAGCGTGRLAIELTRRGHRCVGVDLDPDMIERARAKAPTLEWHVADLATLSVGGEFDVAVMAGNIPLFCAPGMQRSIVASIASHLRVGGFLVCGWSQETSVDAYRESDLTRDAESVGLEVVHRFSTWDRRPFETDSDYAVIVARRRT
jgi:SAM-dependent methyltransferase